MLNLKQKNRIRLQITVTKINWNPGGNNISDLPRVPFIVIFDATFSDIKNSNKIKSIVSKTIYLDTKNWQSLLELDENSMFESGSDNIGIYVPIKLDEKMYKNRRK